MKPLGILPLLGTFSFLSRAYWGLFYLFLSPYQSKGRFVFYKVRLPERNQDSTFLTWVTRIAINEALMMLRRRPKNMVLPENAAREDKGTEPVEVADLRPTPEQAFAQLEIRVAMMHSISLLRPSLRSVVLLCELQGCTNVETARRLGLSVSAVKSRRFHARRNLSSHFKAHYRMSSRLRLLGARKASC